MVGALFILACMSSINHQPYVVPERLLPKSLPVLQIARHLTFFFLDAPFILPLVAVFLPVLWRSTFLNLFKMKVSPSIVMKIDMFSPVSGQSSPVVRRTVIGRRFPGKDGSVGDHGFARQDGTGAGEFAVVGGEAYECQNRNEDDELDEVGGVGVGEELPEEHEDGLADGDGPDGAVEVAALGTLAKGGAADAGELAESAEEEDQEAERRVGVVVDLLEVPGAGDDGDAEAREVEQGEAEGGIPGEGVADAAVEGVGLVFVEAKDVGTWFGAGKASAEGSDAGGNQDDSEPDEIARVHAVGE
jgi:hypothetical protein